MPPRVVRIVCLAIILVARVRFKGWALAAMYFICSSIFSDKGKVFFISGALLVGMYVLNLVSAIKENLAQELGVDFRIYRYKEDDHDSESLCQEIQGFC